MKTFLNSKEIEYFNGEVLGIETSCDETSCAIVLGKHVFSNIISSQTELHKKWGGIVPEAAARRHVETFLPVLEECLLASGKQLEDIKGIGVTNRPGLVGALSVGVTAGKSLSLALGVPIIGVHHLQAHIMSAWMENEVPFPHVCLLVSGGHTELVLVKQPESFEKIGGTIDDAAGEAFDKAARALGLGFPGGPAIQKAGATGDSAKYNLPRGLADPNTNFSFAGLKTALMLLIEKEGRDLDIASASACFEETVSSVLTERTVYACEKSNAKAITLVGGVAANLRLRTKLKESCEQKGFGFFVPSFVLCTDNGAMIAHSASRSLGLGLRDSFKLETLATASI